MNPIVKVIDNITIDSKEYRIIQSDFFEYKEDFNEDISESCIPIYRGTVIAVEVHKKFLFITYWSTLKTYFTKSFNAIPIQIYNIKKWFNKNIRNGKL